MYEIHFTFFLAEKGFEIHFGFLNTAFYVT